MNGFANNPADDEKMSFMELEQEQDEKYQFHVKTENNLNKEKSTECGIEMKTLFSGSDIAMGETTNTVVYDFELFPLMDVIRGLENVNLTEENKNNNNVNRIEIPWWKYKISDLESAINISPDGGVKKIIIETGHGDSPCYGSEVVISYSCYICEDNSFQLMTRVSKSDLFPLGKGSVILGLDMGIATMKKGEISLFMIEPEYAFGKLVHKDPSFAPKRLIYFYDVNLLEWKLEDLSPQKDETILRQIVSRGEVKLYPNDGSIVTIDMCGLYNNIVFERRTICFVLGEGFDVRIPQGVEIALAKFKLNEKSLLFLKGKYAMDLQDRIIEPLDSDSVVKYDITLRSVEKVKEVWEMNSDEKYESALKAKEKGLFHFKNSYYRCASKQFKKIIMYLENEPGVPPAKAEARKELVRKAYLNDALCLMKLNNFQDAIRACNKAVELDFITEKAFYRRAQCYFATNDWNKAVKDFRAVLHINPNNTASQKMIPVCLKKISEQEAKDKSTYYNMFQKFVYEDEVSVKIKEEEIIKMLD